MDVELSVCVCLIGAIAPTTQYSHSQRFIFTIAAARSCRTYRPDQYINHSGNDSIVGVLKNLNQH